MIPEGLEWASVEEILDDIASVGWNYIRMYVFHAVLTYASLTCTGATLLRWSTKSTTGMEQTYLLRLL